MSLHTQKKWSGTWIKHYLWRAPEHPLFLSGHFQVTNWLKPFIPCALAQVSPNLEKYITEAETGWTGCSQAMSTVRGQHTKCANRGSLQPAPGPFPASTQLLRTADFCCLSLMKVRPELATYTATHELHFHCQNTNRSLSSICATLTSPSYSLCGPELKYI